MFVVMVLAFLVIPPVDQTTAGSTGIPQEAKVNQKKIDRDRAKKEKEAQKDYEKAVKRHMDNQSKETKAMMKKAKKDSKKNTPLK
jgi:hypothetical protein